MSRAAEWILRLGLGGLFVWAGVAKLRDPTAFANEVVNYHLVPGLAPLLAAVLPVVEIVAGAGVVLLPAIWRRGAALALAGLCAVFTVAVAQAAARGINVDCGCFGGGAGPVTGWTAARDVALTASAIGLYLLTPGRRAAAG